MHYLPIKNPMERGFCRRASSAHITREALTVGDAFKKMLVMGEFQIWNSHNIRQIEQQSRFPNSPIIYNTYCTCTICMCFRRR